MTYLTRFTADSTAEGITSGTATYTVGDTVLSLHLSSYQDAANIDKLIAIVAKTAKRAQARYLKGAINHLIDDAS